MKLTLLFAKTIKAILFIHNKKKQIITLNQFKWTNKIIFKTEKIYKLKRKKLLFM